MNYSPTTISRGAGVYPLHETIIIDPHSTFAELVNQWRPFYQDFMRNLALQKALPTILVESMKDFPIESLIILNNYYTNIRGFGNFRKSAEPDWFNKLPLRYQRILNVSHVMGEGCDPLAILPNVPFHGFGYIVEDNGLVHSLYKAFGLARLSGIRQLAYLHDHQGTDSIPCIETCFEHTRYVHILDTMAIAGLIEVNNPELEPFSKLIRTGAVLHDILTPAGGDTTKIIDRLAFDEDTHFPELLSQAKWNEFNEIFGIQRQSLIEMINGQGLCGRILDLSDKTAYIARDLSQFLQRGMLNGLCDYPEIYLPLRELVQKYPHVCALWAHTKIIDGDLVITDPEILNAFLQVRALLFRGLYYNPRCKLLEYIVAKKLIGWGYYTKQISRRNLLTWTDFNLNEWLNVTTGFSMHLTILEHCDVEEFDCLEDAKRREGELNVNPDILTSIEVSASHTKDGTDSFKVRKNRKTLSFRDAYPEWAKNIHSIMADCMPKKYRLYSASMDGLLIKKDPSLRKILKEFICPQKLE